MPFKSIAQRKFLWANDPKVAKKFAEDSENSSSKKLPYKVKKKKGAK